MEIAKVRVGNITAQKMTVYVGDIAKQITMVVNVKGTNPLAWRFWLGSIFFRIGARIVRINVELEK